MKYIPTKASRSSNEKMNVNASASTSLGTLAGTTAILRPGPVMLRGGRALSVTGANTISGLTAGDGPFEFGIMSGELTLSELTAYLEQNGPTTPGLISEEEIASRGRYIRRLGNVRPVGDGTVAVGDYLKNSGLSGLRFIENSEGQGGWDWWLYNLGQTMTTGATWRVATSVFVEFNPSG